MHSCIQLALEWMVKSEKALGYYQVTSTLASDCCFRYLQMGKIHKYLKYQTKCFNSTPKCTCRDNAHTVKLNVEITVYSRHTISILPINTQTHINRFTRLAHEIVEGEKNKTIKKQNNNSN